MRNTSSKVVDFTEPNTCGAWKVTYILKNPMALETSFILFPREIPQRFAIKQLRLWFCADATSEKKKITGDFPKTLCLVFGFGNYSASNS